jgi:hypothetical protein
LQPQQQERRLERQALRTRNIARVTPESAAQGRFAARAAALAAAGAGAAAFDRRHRWAGRDAGLAPRHAWRRGLKAVFVPWFGPVFWPYAYSDIFEYTFWPEAYEETYWAYAYDEFIDGVFLGYGSPSARYAVLGPPGGGERLDNRRIGRRGAPPAASERRAVDQLCTNPGRGVTSWPFEQIADAVRPTSEQRALLDEVKQASAQAADILKQACSTEFSMTPPGRLQAMLVRLEATLEAVRTVAPALERFYESLTDEQKARFNALGPEFGDRNRRARTRPEQVEDVRCEEPKRGLVDLPIERIEDTVRPTDEQQPLLDRLADATKKAVEILQSACPDVIALTPVGRLAAMEKRLEAMIGAARELQPALEAFYASLSDEQKERFNRLGSQTAQR